ncbi:DDE superfamily endonuclease [Popillia japonica]|uniref:DDE superfamily endonuclease n=1 Tax=Popillia japonica TaxID=7064 RepID=A0AAW1L2Z3_POPJA
MNKLLKKYIVWPSHSECFTIAQQFFEASGYPDVIGAIDGCHVTCKIPYGQHDSYQDRKFNHSIPIQAACTTERIFTHISVGYPGAIHDARESSIGQITRDNADTLFYTRFHLVGDSAYPCKTWFMSPFRDNGRLTQQQKKHNYALSRARVVIENVFGLLKGRWRILNFVNVYSIEKAMKIITCCCILHNFCLINHDDFDAAHNFEHEHRGNYEEQVVDDNGAQKRMTICDMF